MTSIHINEMIIHNTNIIHTIRIMIILNKQTRTTKKQTFPRKNHDITTNPKMYVSIFQAKVQFTCAEKELQQAHQITSMTQSTC